MIHETLAKTNLESAKLSSQTLHTSSTVSPRLATGLRQGSNEALSVRSAAGSTQGLNSGHNNISDLPSKVNEDYNMILLFPPDGGMRHKSF